jgi:hypothetical protein
MCPYVKKTEKAGQKPSSTNETELLLESKNDNDTCDSLRKLNQEIIMNKMAKPETLIGRVIGNIFHKFSNDSRTHQV